jgi:lipid-binding SYLF domain-containing protein
MNRVIRVLALAGVFALGCAHAPTKPGERADLKQAADQTVATMTADDPSLQPVLDQAAAYIVFPRIGSGGFIVGGGAGSGVLYEHGQQTGFATVEHLKFGALAGGQQYAQIVVFQDAPAVQRLRAGRFEFGASASAVILRSGAAATASFNNGVAVFRKPLKGAMASAALGSQRIRLRM